MHTEAQMAFSIAASPSLGLERSSRPTEGRRVARCVFFGLHRPFSFREVEKPYGRTLLTRIDRPNRTTGKPVASPRSRAPPAAPSPTCGFPTAFQRESATIYRPQSGRVIDARVVSGLCASTVFAMRVSAVRAQKICHRGHVLQVNGLEHRVPTHRPSLTSIPPFFSFPWRQL